MTFQQHRRCSAFISRTVIACGCPLLPWRTASWHSGIAYFGIFSTAERHPHNIKTWQEAIAKLLLEGRNKAPLKFIEAIELEEFTLGLAPPRFHRANVRYNAAKNYLQFEVDMNFQTTGFQCVVRDGSLKLCRTLKLPRMQNTCHGSLMHCSCYRPSISSVAH